MREPTSLPAYEWSAEAEPNNNVGTETRDSIKTVRRINTVGLTAAMANLAVANLPGFIRVSKWQLSNMCNEESPPRRRRQSTRCSSIPILIDFYAVVSISNEISSLFLNVCQMPIRRLVTSIIGNSPQMYVPFQKKRSNGDNRMELRQLNYRALDNRSNLVSSRCSWCDNIVITFITWSRLAWKNPQCYRVSWSGSRTNISTRLGAL